MQNFIFSRLVHVLMWSQIYFNTHYSSTKKKKKEFSLGSSSFPDTLCCDKITFMEPIKIALESFKKGGI